MHVFWVGAESSFLVLALCSIAFGMHVITKLEINFLFFSSPALIKSDLRRHNVNSGIVNMDIKAVSGDSFTLIILLHLNDWLLLK